MPKLSIIVPVYNVEKYLCKCIDSILNQTFKDFELILVDDGSQDRCGFICDDYAKKDCRVKVIHKINGGLSSARNAGLDISKGEYIGFVDSDDFIERDMYESLIKAIEKSEAKIAITGIQTITNNKVERTFYTEEEKILSSYEALRLILYGKISVSVWNKIYHNEIFKKLRFPEGKIHEDTFIVTDIYKDNFKVIFLNNEKYNYIIRDGSIMDQIYKKPNNDSIEAYNNIFKYCKSSYPNKVYELFWPCTSFNWNLIRGVYYNKKWRECYDYIETMYNYLRENIEMIFCNKYLNIEVKYEMVIFILFIKNNKLIYYLFVLKNKFLCEINKISKLIRGYKYKWRIGQQ